MWEQAIDDHLRVRPLTRADAQALFDVVDANRAHLRQWLPWLDFVGRPEDELAFLDRVESRLPGTSMISGILVDTALAGVVGFNTIDDASGHGTIGYWLAERFGGRGIMTRCVAALTTYGFERLSLRTIDIRAATGNARSRAIPERLGFTLRGVIPQAEWLYDHHVDHAEYVIAKEEWRGHRDAGTRDG